MTVAVPIGSALAVGARPEASQTVLSDPWPITAADRLAARGTPRPRGPGLFDRAARDQRDPVPKLPPGSPDG